MPKINKALAILAALAFFLPFITISCNGKALVEMSGVKVAKCSVSTCSADDLLSPDLKALSGRNLPDINIPTAAKDKAADLDGANFALFAAIACLVAALTLFFPGRGGELLSGLASVAGMVLLFMFRSKFSDAITPHLHSPQVGAAAALLKIELQFSLGFWLSLIFSAASAILAFKGAGPQVSLAGGARRPVGGFTPPSSGTPAGGQQMSACPACGTSNAAGHRFCRACGGSLAATAPAKQGSSCPACGATAVAGSKFCLSCGASLAAPAKAAQAPETSAAQPVESPAAVSVEATPPIKTAAAAASVAQPLAGEQQPATPFLEPAAVSAPALVLASTEPPNPQRQVCAVCGTEIAPSHRFCLACGAAVGQTAKASEQTLQTPQPPFPAQASLSTPAPVSAIRASEPGPFPETPGRDRTLGMIVAVLLVVMGIAGWFVWRVFARPDVTITTFQKKIHVAAGGKTSLQASVTGSSDTDVDWSIQEGDKGGRVVSMGSVTEQNQSHASATYTAPQSGGTFHVIAASHANPSRTAKIEIVVGGAGQLETTVSSTPAPPAVTTNGASSQILGAWRGPAPDMKTTIATSTIVIASDTDPQKNLNGTYRFTDASHVQVDFGNGDVRTWQILGVDSNYLRVLSQSKTESSPTAIIFARIN